MERMVKIWLTLFKKDTDELICQQWQINWVVFQLYHGENKLHFNEIMMSTLY